MLNWLPEMGHGSGVAQQHAPCYLVKKKKKSLLLESYVNLKVV